MRILQAAHYFLPRRKAGCEIYTDQLSRALQREGHEVAVAFTEKILGRQQGSIREHDQQGLACFEIVNQNLARGFRETYDDPVMEAAFVKVLDAFRPDLVHFQHLMHLSITCVTQARARGIPTAMTLHDFWAACPRFGQMRRDDGELCDRADPAVCAPCMTRFSWGQGKLERVLIPLVRAARNVTGFDPGPWLQRVRKRIRRDPGDTAPRGVTPRDIETRLVRLRDTLRSVDCLMTTSCTVQKRVCAIGISPEHLRVQRIGLDASDFRGMTKTRGDRLRVGLLGTLAPHKGIHVAVAAFQAIPRALAELHIYGTGRYQPTYVASLREAAAGHPIVFRGEFTHGRIGEIFRDLDVLLMPSIWPENSPLAIYEAFLSGTPVVCSDFGGMAELVVEGRNGLRFPVGDAAALRERILRLARDPGLRARLVEGIGRVKTMDEHVKEIEALYEQAVERAAGRDGAVRRSRAERGEASGTDAGPDAP